MNYIKINLKLNFTERKIKMKKIKKISPIYIYLICQALIIFAYEFVVMNIDVYFSIVLTGVISVAIFSSLLLIWSLGMLLIIFLIVLLFPIPIERTNPLAKIFKWQSDIMGWFLKKNQTRPNAA